MRFRCGRRWRFVAVAACGLVGAAPAQSRPAELKPPTLEAFERYVRLREAQLEAEIRLPAPFLWVDALPESRRRQAYEELRRGDVVIERMRLRDTRGRAIDCPDGLIHHWMGTVFIPGATLAQTIELVQDYDRHHLHYAPDVLRASTLERRGNDFKIHMRFLKKKVITVVVDTYQDVRYLPLSPTRLHSRAYTTQVREVENPGKPSERQKPEGHDGGFLWRLYTYWLFEERDGGTYVQCEAVSLTRDIPFLLTWLKPFLTSVPRESLLFTLGTTRSLVLKKNAAVAAP